MLKKHGFVLALVASVGLAAVFPRWGAPDGPLHADLLSKLGVMVIFFLQGLTLNTRYLAQGVQNVRLHAFIQAWIFIFSAAIFLFIAWLLSELALQDLADGFLYLALIPTTISSAVAFTGAANGNVPAAIFNVTLANVIGVFWVPAGCLIMFSTGNSLQADLVLPLLWKIVQLILLPLIAGQFLRPLVFERDLFQRIAPSFKLINHSIILFIVFAAFCRSFLSDSWSGTGAGSIWILLGATLAAVLLIHWGAWVSSGWIAISPQERVSALFCGSQKTLAAGAPMAVAIFANESGLSGSHLGLLMLPLLCYHPVQLFLAALLLPKLTASR